MAQDTFWATGSRKEATARVGIKSGTGKQEVNGIPLKDYFHRETLVMVLRQPLEVVDMADRLDVICRASGGGKAGQAGALRMGLARALVAMNPEWRAKLKQGGFLTRDSRMVERKKYGQVKARKRFQYSKR